MTVLHIVVAMKPVEGNYADNAIEHGIAGLNIDGSRVEGHNPSIDRRAAARKAGRCSSYEGISKEDRNALELAGHLCDARQFETYAPDRPSEHLGRWPANVVLDGSEEVKAEFPETGSGNCGKPYSYSGREYNNKDTSMFNGDKPQDPSNFNDKGSASRFFKECKA